MESGADADAYAYEGHTHHVNAGSDAGEAPLARTQEHWIHNSSHVSLVSKSREFKEKKLTLYEKLTAKKKEYSP